MMIVIASLSAWAEWWDAAHAVNRLDHGKAQVQLRQRVNKRAWSGELQAWGLSKLKTGGGLVTRSLTGVNGSFVNDRHPPLSRALLRRSRGSSSSRYVGMLRVHR